MTPTYNRSRLLSRAIKSVLMQDFHDYELIVIDDCSTDNTQEVIASFNDPRIRKIRNETNVAQQHGDRAHFRRLLNDLMRGRYFIYLCDDDYWLSTNLLSRLVSMLEAHPDLSMVIGGQLSQFITTSESYLGSTPEDPVMFTRETLQRYFDFSTMKSKTPHLSFLSGIHPKTVMTSEEYLMSFSDEPASKHHSIGATLYSREHFIRSGTLSSPLGCEWQGGYEYLMGPAMAGGVCYLDEPAVLTEIRPSNASFRKTQVDHYYDAMVSIDTAFKYPMSADEFKNKRKFLLGVRAKTIRNLTRAFLSNSVSILRHGALTLCSEENISRRVTFKHALPIYLRNGIRIEKADFELMFVLPLRAAAARRQELRSAKATE